MRPSLQRPWPPRVWIMVLMSIAMMGTETDSAKSVLLIIVDDLGERDVAVYQDNSDMELYETPNLTQLAKEGVHFTNSYSTHPKCRRSRAGIFSGRHPSKLGLSYNTFAMFGYNKTVEECWKKHRQQPVPLHTHTMGTVFKDQGYQTGYIGKWHSGLWEECPNTCGICKPGLGQPRSHGFDLSRGVTQGLDGTHFFPYYKSLEEKCFNKNAIPNDFSVEVDEGTLSPDHLGAEAVEMIKNFRATNSEQPFFMVLSFYAMHEEVQAYDEDRKYFEQKYLKLFGTTYPPADDDYTKLYKQRENTVYMQTQRISPVYAGMLKAVDKNVGLVVQALKDNDKYGDTIVALTSDNGGLATHETLKRLTNSDKTSNMPYNLGKAYLKEGGIRVPLIIKANGAIDPNTKSNYVANGLDLFPTLIGLAGIKAPKDSEFDGESLLPALKKTHMSRISPLYWEYTGEKYRNGRHMAITMAVRKGNWKLIETYEHKHVKSVTTELYNMIWDIGEEKNLSHTKKKLRKCLKKMLKKWRKKWFDTDYARKMLDMDVCGT